MALAHTPLDPTRLSPAAQKALGPGPTRLMAARGVLPQTRVGDVGAVYYPHAVDHGLVIAADPRVLDCLPPRCAANPVLHDALVAAPAVADETIAWLAAKGDARAVDLIAQNEQRLLRAPAIIAAMYGNPKARMSTVDRAVE